VALVLGMQDLGLSSTLQQLKTKVAKLTQSRPTFLKMDYLKEIGGINLNVNI
jgi:hypothetical protein